MGRWKEPSTHAGIATILLALSTAFPQYTAIVQSIAGVFGTLAISLREGRTH